MKQLTLKINDKDYKLEMNRDSIKWLEANGFMLENFYAKPLTYYDLLWTSLFIANHKDVSSNLAMKLMDTYEKSGKKAAKVIKFAIDEYQSFMSALADTDSDEKDEDLIITEI